MNTDTPITPETLPTIVWQEHKVITTQLLALIYQVDNDKIRKNYNRNTARFTEGVHYFKLQGQALKGFKALHNADNETQSPNKMHDLLDDLGVGLGYPFENKACGNSEGSERPTAKNNKRSERPSVKIASNACSLMLWTERGAARHSKILDNDISWDMFDKMEVSYFHQQIPAHNPELQALQAENAQLLGSAEQLQTQLTQQTEMLELYRFKSSTLEKQSQPRKRKPSRPLTENDINAINALHEQGISNTQIAKKTGFSGATVSYVVRSKEGKL